MRSLLAILAVLAITSCGGGPNSTLATRPVSSHSTRLNGANTVLAGSANSATVTPQRPSRSARPLGTDDVIVDVMEDRHPISLLIYGANFPSSTSYVTDAGVTLVRWGGNASTPYNWKNFDTNASADWYFQNRSMDDSNPLYQDSTFFVSSIAGTGAVPIMSIGMLPWVAKNGNYDGISFSVKKYGAQCGVNPYYSDDGNGIKSGCNTSSPVYVTGNDPNDAYVPLLDSPGSNDPSGSLYRSEWVQALAPNFGSEPHWYDMDNEMDIWAGTHRDIHPDPVTYEEMRDRFLSEARAVKSWDPSAVRLGPVSCCWWFYWNSEAGATDKSAHGGADFLPWWLNEIAWADKIAGSRSLDVFDIHAYPDADHSGFTQAQLQAQALRVMRDWWDPTYTSESQTINQQWTTQTQPNACHIANAPCTTIPFRIPRLRAMLNSIYPGTPLSFTEWNAAFAGETDFSTALVDMDAYGILGRERVYAATRWTAADAATPAYQALKLFRNYDGQHHTFGSISVSAKNGGDPDFFSSYAAIDTAGTTLKVMLVNKDPSNIVRKSLTLSGFHASQVTTYTLSSASPTTIVAGSSQAWTNQWSLPPYSATLLVISGTTVSPNTAEWDLNPDTTQIPALGTTTLQPKITSASGSITLAQASSDAGITVALTQPRVTTSQMGSISVSAGATPGFYRFSVLGVDGSGVQQTQEGWILVGNPAASLIKTGDGQSATRGTKINLSVQLNVGQSGGNANGASILFTTDQGTLSAREVQTNSSGIAGVQLTLPNSAATVHVTAEGPYGLGHPVVTFTETSQ